HNYRKALYLDSDLAVLRDVAELYRLDMKENRIAAVVDYMAVIKRRKLCNDFVLALKGKKWQEYFNSGVLLFNVGKIDGGDFLDKNLKFICLFHGKFKYHDQDVLNALHSDDVLLLDSKWNMLYNVVRRRTGGRKPTRENAYVIHYASGLKPWNSRNLAYGDVWLEYAQKTPFYEDILKNIETCEAKKNNGTRK
ncbi:MAG: hypothetical protein LBB63_02985, partial [Holosporaceae bacterium]|nr:hypothetical protein [Holosporaceae bacterium]